MDRRAQYKRALAEALRRQLASVLQDNPDCIALCLQVEDSAGDFEPPPRCAPAVYFSFNTEDYVRWAEGLYSSEAVRRWDPTTWDPRRLIDLTTQAANHDAIVGAWFPDEIFGTRSPTFAAFAVEFGEILVEIVTDLKRAGAMELDGHDLPMILWMKDCHDDDIDEFNARINCRPVVEALAETRKEQRFLADSSSVDVDTSPIPRAVLNGLDRSRVFRIASSVLLATERWLRKR